MEKLVIKHLLELANNGDIEAMLKLGDYYFPKCDYESALYWYHKAAKNGKLDVYLKVAHIHELMDLKEYLENLSKDKDIDDEYSDTSEEFYKMAFEYFVEKLNEEIKDTYDYEHAFHCFVEASHLCSGDEIYKLWSQMMNTKM